MIDQQRYMNELYASVLRLLEDDSIPAYYINAMLDNYESKVNLGWPKSQYQ